MLADDEHFLYPQTVFLARWHRMEDMIGPLVSAKDTRERIPQVGDWVTLVSRKKRWPAEITRMVEVLPSGDIRIETTRGGSWSPTYDPFMHPPAGDADRSRDPDDVPF